MTKILSLAAALLCTISANAFVPNARPMGVRKSTSIGPTLEGRLIEGEIKPTNNFILVKVAPDIEQTEGGIILAGKNKVKKTEGTVVSTGPGKTHQESGIFYPMPVSEGEGVVYGKYDGTEIEYNGDKHTLIRDDDILVKYTGEKLTLESADVISDNVLVSVNEEEEQSTAGGLLIASTSNKKRPSTGTVVKVGPGRMASNGVLMEMDIAVDDMVKFRDFAGNEVTIEGKDYSVVRFVDILAKF